MLSGVVPGSSGARTAYAAASGVGCSGSGNVSSGAGLSGVLLRGIAAGKEVAARSLQGHVGRPGQDSHQNGEDNKPPALPLASVLDEHLAAGGGGYWGLVGGWP